MKPLIMSFTAALCLVAAGMAVPAFAQTAFAQTSAPQRSRSTVLRGIASRGYLGVGVAELTDDRVKALNLKDDQGLEVKRVDENSPAAKAGLKENDVILEVNGKSVEGIHQFQVSIGETSPGSMVSLTIWRNGAKQTVSATSGYEVSHAVAWRRRNASTRVGRPTPTHHLQNITANGSLSFERTGVAAQDGFH